MQENKYEEELNKINQSIEKAEKENEDVTIFYLDKGKLYKKNKKLVIIDQDN